MNTYTALIRYPAGSGGFSPKSPFTSRSTILANSIEEAREKVREGMRRGNYGNGKLISLRKGDLRQNVKSTRM